MHTLAEDRLLAVLSVIGLKQSVTYSTRLSKPLPQTWHIKSYTIEISEPRNSNTKAGR